MTTRFWLLGIVLVADFAYAQQPTQQPQVVVVDQSQQPVIVVVQDKPQPAESVDPERLDSSCGPPETDDKMRFITGCGGTSGIRGVYTGLSNVNGPTGATVAWGSEQEEYFRRDTFIARIMTKSWIGGGETGFDAGFDVALAAGVRFSVEKHHGLLVRGGFRGAVMGSDAWYFSLLELPQGQLGWQWQKGILVAEIAFDTGLVLTGRYRAGTSLAPMRELRSGFEFGGHAAIQLRHLRVGFNYAHIPSGDDGINTPVDMAMLQACAIFMPVAVCVDGRALRGAVHTGLTTVENDAGVSTWGVTLALSRER